MPKRLQGAVAVAVEVLYLRIEVGMAAPTVEDGDVVASAKRRCNEMAAEEDRTAEDEESPTSCQIEQIPWPTPIHMVARPNST